MIKNIFKLLLLLVPISALAQEKNFIDQPYLEISTKVDTTVIPDRIYISIIIKESDSKGKKSTEELEKLLINKLEQLNIDTKKNLSLINYSSNYKNYFLKSQDILKSKHYNLITPDAITAGEVLYELESIGISNIYIEKTEYSRKEELESELNSKAILKAKKNALRLLIPINQKVGKALFISNTTNSNFIKALQSRIPGMNVSAGSGTPGNSKKVTEIEFEKIKFETSILVRFAIE